MKSKTLKNSRLIKQLHAQTQGEVLFDDFSRGIYSTDASIYQIMPLGVFIPKRMEDVSVALEIATLEGISVTPRGGGTSQCGQTVGEGLIIDVSKHLNRIRHLDVKEKIVVVEPGIVLDELNTHLKQHGLFFPVDVSTSNRATLGGMTGNNSCGARSIRYGKMVDNVIGVETLLADGNLLQFKELSKNEDFKGLDRRHTELIKNLLKIGKQEEEEVLNRIPKLQRRVGGYNIDELSSKITIASQKKINPARLLVGSEGTLAFTTAITLKLHSIPAYKVLGVCHFPSFFEAMDSTQHLMNLEPDAVELVDRTMIELARSIPQFKSKIKRFLKGEPDALLLVEFSGEELTPLKYKLIKLNEMMESFGFPNSVVEALDPSFQNDIWTVRKSGLNIMMSMKGDSKPVSCIEDCAVELKDLAEYTSKLNDLFKKYGTTGTWYAHASVGCLHVRPVLNMKKEESAIAMRKITEEAFTIVREYKGSHSGEHGDGLVRSEFLEFMYGRRLVNAFKKIKTLFDPDGILNPGKIVNPEKMDDRRLFRYSPEYYQSKINENLDWSEWGGFQDAVEMCNNNGACRKIDTEVMCPSYRVTLDEKHLTRGRANSLRLALSGQLGPKALTSEDMYKTMQLCVGCKACSSECPTGVDMTRMKSEFLYHYHNEHGIKLRDKIFAYLPRYASLFSNLSPIFHLRDRLPGLTQLSEKLMGLSSRRPLPHWSSNPFHSEEISNKDDGFQVIVLSDTFNTWFEPECLRDAIYLLNKLGYKVQTVGAATRKKRLCCGRTFLSSGLLDEARKEAEQVISIIYKYIKQNIPVIGLEPSCIFTIRNDYPALIPSIESKTVAKNIMLIDEFLHREQQEGLLNLKLNSLPFKQVWVHGHCHQKAGNAMESTIKLLKNIPKLKVKMIQSSCCGMAGSFGYESENYETSIKMAEINLLPKIRSIPKEDHLVACGTSCRQQIKHGSGRVSLHTVQLLKKAMDCQS